MLMHWLFWIINIFKFLKRFLCRCSWTSGLPEDLFSDVARCSRKVGVQDAHLHQQGNPQLQSCQRRPRIPWETRHDEGWPFVGVCSRPLRSRLTRMNSKTEHIGEDKKGETSATTVVQWRGKLVISPGFRILRRKSRQSRGGSNLRRDVSQERGICQLIVGWAEFRPDVDRPTSAV